MKRKKKLSDRLQIIIKLFFLAIFIALFAVKKMWWWFFIFGTGTVVSVFFSRFYCGWICPMKTLFRPINWVYSKLKIRRLKMPKLFKTAMVRYITLVFFVGAILFTKWKKMSIPLPVIVIGISLLVTLIFEESFWHNTICPYGTILSLTSRPAVRSVTINEDLCISCGKCQKICPSCVINTLNTKKRRINKYDCLICWACISVCPTKAIKYRAFGKH